MSDITLLFNKKLEKFVPEYKKIKQNFQQQ